MAHFHAVMLDECGGEFGAGVTAETRAEAYANLAENYPESRVIQLESPQDTRDRENRIYASIQAEYDGDDFDEEDY